MPTKLIVDCSTGVTTEVELSAEEVAQREADRIAYEAEKERLEQEKLATEELKTSANAKLAALGLTPEEIQAITK
jgi:hydroxylamine reductase (hybrid-cluster protein)